MVFRLHAFTGKEKWEVWINRFEAVSRLHQWNDEWKLNELLPRIQGEAGDFAFDQLCLWDFPRLLISSVELYSVILLCIRTTKSFLEFFNKQIVLSDS
jgi:hypothetical protein